MKKERENKELPAGWIEQPTSSLRVTRSTTELSGLRNPILFWKLLIVIIPRARNKFLSVSSVECPQPDSLQHRPPVTSRSTSIIYFNPTFSIPWQTPRRQRQIRYSRSLKLVRETRCVNHAAQLKMANHTFRCALTVKPATQRGPVSRLACIYVSIVPACTVTWACISRLFGMPLMCFLEWCTLQQLTISFQGQPTSTVGNSLSCAR